MGVMSHRWRKFVLVVVGGYLLISIPMPAQEIEEMVVTAQKREQNLREVTLSVGVLSDQRTENLLAANTDILKLSGRLPSLRVETSNGRLIPRFYIRGLGNIDFDINASQPISLVYDDVVLENPAAKSFPMFDIERVEVLRGPQGSLFGRNTTGGIVKLDSRRPSAEREGYFNSALGQRGFRMAEVAVGGPLGNSNTTGRLSLYYEGLNDWMDNVAAGFEKRDALGGYEETAFRLQLAWDSGERLAVLLNLHGRSFANGTPSQFRANIIEPGSSNVIDGFKREQLFQDSWMSAEQDQRQAGVIGTVRYALGDLDFVSITGLHTIIDSHSRGDIDGGYGSVFGGVLPSGPPPGIPFDAQTADGLIDHGQVTQEFRLESDISPNGFQWRIGIYRFSEELVIQTTNYDSVFDPGTINGLVFQNQRTTALALFGTFDYQLAENVHMNAGWRYSNDKKNLVANRTLSPLSFLGVGPIGPLEVSPGDRVFTGDWSMLYEYSDTTNLYGRIALGHRAPSIQGRLLFQDTISVADTELNRSMEVGMKGRYRDGRFVANFSVYTYTVVDQQLTRIGGEANISELINADRTHGKGFEFEVDALLGSSVTLVSGVSFNWTEIDDPDLTINGCGSAALLSGCTVVDSIAPNGEYSIDGNSLYNAPEWSGQIALTYNREVKRGRLFLQTEWVYHSEVRYTLYESLEYGDDGLIEGGARFGFATLDDGFQVALVGRNITDDTSLVGAIDFNNLTGYVNEPRSWTLELRARF